MSSDQQPFLQGYLPVVSLCSSIKRKMTPLTVDTGTGLVTPENAPDIAELVKQGIR
jgi:simple sugar transport system substrate-binding protein